MKWLLERRRAFDKLTATEVIQTEAGRQLVGEVLGQLDSGYFA